MLENNYMTSVSKKNEGGLSQNLFSQYMTPPSVANFMASLLSPPIAGKDVCYLDAGAGKGALTNAFLKMYSEVVNASPHVVVDLYEVDPQLIPMLQSCVSNAAPDIFSKVNIIIDDFIKKASDIISEGGDKYTHALLNPPYQKLNGSSQHRLMLEKHNIQCSNLYTAFISLSVMLLRPGGCVVAIVPRSFCNGLYHKKFRDFILNNCVIKHIHLFKSRTKTFYEDNILQENVILSLEKSKIKGNVVLSTSTDGTFSDYESGIFRSDEVVLDDDLNKFIRIPIASSNREHLHVTESLDQLGLMVSTGPVVDFRARRFIRQLPENRDDVPLIYPGHLNGVTTWPKKNFKKPNAIRRCVETEKMLFPTGYYVAIRRMSSKEERRRIVAHLISPDDFSGYSHLGFENHLNIIHSGKKGIRDDLARGLVAYLNSSCVNSLFHSFNGHTQVNATDLRSLMYPTRSVLTKLGQWIKKQGNISLESIDERLKKVCISNQ